MESILTWILPSEDLPADLDWMRRVATLQIVTGS